MCGSPQHFSPLLALKLPLLGASLPFLPTFEPYMTSVILASSLFISWLSPGLLVLVPSPALFPLSFSLISHSLTPHPPLSLSSHGPVQSGDLVQSVPFQMPRVVFFLIINHLFNPTEGQSCPHFFYSLLREEK